MVEIKKKIWPEFFDNIESGKKKFDLRLADVDINEGDVLILEEFDPETKQYTGRKIEKEIKFVLKTKDLKFWSKEDIEKYGLVVVGF
tara:strand:+ start:2375 stop:2635 length:261 start_codon:yes stop_codon:yes gene_type:complete